jgi:hypothetical protein
MLGQARASLTRSVAPSAIRTVQETPFHEWSTAKAFKTLADAQKEHTATLAAGNKLLPGQQERIQSAVREARGMVRRHGAHDPRIAAVSERYGFGPQHRDALAGTFHEDLAPDFRRMLAPS